MELSLKMEGLKCARQVWRGTVTREELSEHIVPDSCPDVQKMLDVECLPLLNRAEAAEGRVDFSGTIRCEILYLPENEREVVPVTVTIPFQFMEERQGVTSKSVVQASVRASRGEVRMLNPRKMLLRVELIIEVWVFQKEEQQFCSQLPAQEESLLQQQSTSATGKFIISTPMKPFTFSDRLSFPGIRPAAARILKRRGWVEVTDARVVGTKVVLKGSVRLTLLCQEEEGGIFPVDFELPFSQIMDGEGAEEGSDVEADIQIVGMNCTLADAGRTVEVELELTANAVVRQDKTVELVSDAYSVLFPTELRCRDTVFPTQLDGGIRRQSSRFTLDTPEEWESIADLWAVVGLVTQVQDGTIHRITADVGIHVLGQKESGGFYSAEKSVPVTLEVETPENATLTCRWELVELHGDRISGGVEFRFTMVYQYQIIAEDVLPVVSGLTMDREHPWDLAGRPSLVLRRVESGDTLWKLAREYLTSVEAIQQANGLEGDGLNMGQFLLIPKFR